MERRAMYRFVGIILAFIVLIVGYVYFSEQSLLSSGRTNSDTIVQQIEDGDVEGVIAKIDEFVGVVNPDDEDYYQAIVSLQYVSEVVADGGSITYIQSELGSTDDYRVFSAVYEIPAPQGGTDFLNIVLRREDDTWRLANTQLLATNPLED